MHGSRTDLQRGFNIIEVMMATAILMMGFLGLIRAVTICSESLHAARKQQVAVQIATAEIENLRGGSWSNITSLPVTGAITVDSSGLLSGDTICFALANHTVSQHDDNAELCALARGFTCAFTRTFLRPSSATAATATFIKVVYTVSWTTNTGRVQRYQTDAYLTKNGLHVSYQQS